MLADSLGMFAMGMTMGLVPWYWVSNKIRDSTARRYARKQLFS